MRSNSKIQRQLVLFSILAALVFAFHARRTKSEETTTVPLQPNEMGSVMVLMWHDIRSPEAEWSRTPENFEKDLTALYEQNFRPISLDDFVHGRIDIPRGTSPVVLTFDDATLGQFKIVTENGQPSPDPRSAVGILERFHQIHPDFPLEATFFANGRTPFKEPEFVAFKLNYIVSRGMDIGNHTTGHQNLRRPENAFPEKIQSAIGGQAAYLERRLTAHTGYKVNTFALCFGQRPKKSFLLKYLLSGVSNGIPYENVAVLNVGSSPSYSPIDSRFNPLSIPRVRASKTHAAGVGLYARLKYYAEHPEARFVSDGDPEIFTIPAAAKKTVNSNRLAGRTVTAY